MVEVASKKFQEDSGDVKASLGAFIGISEVSDGHACGLDKSQQINQVH